MLQIKLDLKKHIFILIIIPEWAQIYRRFWNWRYWSFPEKNNTHKTIIYCHNGERILNIPDPSHKPCVYNYPLSCSFLVSIKWVNFTEPSGRDWVGWIHISVWTLNRKHIILIFHTHIQTFRPWLSNSSPALPRRASYLVFWKEKRRETQWWVNCYIHQHLHSITVHSLWLDSIMKGSNQLGISTFQLNNRLTSDLPVNCITAVILVIICTGTPRLLEHNAASLANVGQEDAFDHYDGGKGSREKDRNLIILCVSIKCCVSLSITLGNVILKSFQLSVSVSVDLRS